MHSVPSPYSRWNYHPEYEVHLIRFGTGRYIVGDRIDAFSAGQLVLVGSNLPHHWISDLEPGEIIADRDIVFQFHPDWIRRCQAVLPELSDVNPLLKKIGARDRVHRPNRARRRPTNCSPSAKPPAPNGCATSSACSAYWRRHPAPSTRRSPRHGCRRWMTSTRPTSSTAPSRYILDNLVGEVRLSAAAELIGMSESAFSKYFKRMSGQTFSDTVRKLRLAQAGKLLKDTDLPVGSIYHRAGYANLSNFNRQFRAQYGVTPREFRRQSQTLSRPVLNLRSSGKKVSVLDIHRASEGRPGSLALVASDLPPRPQSNAASEGPQCHQNPTAVLQPWPDLFDIRKGPPGRDAGLPAQRHQPQLHRPRLAAGRPDHP